ncbi:MAG: hypothetical protein VB084_06235 [Syntrophomonadaceae bacterium]|nr:hypothetical protein [Syntrophomonadaceae bacterium]
MNLKVNRNYIFICIIVIAGLLLAISYTAATEQNRGYRQNYNNFAQAIQLMNQQKYAEAQEILNLLDQDSRQTYQALYVQAICSAKTGDYASAAAFMQQVREAHPAFLMDQQYLEQYGEILYRLGDYDRARLYLSESLKYPNNTLLTKSAQNSLTEIEKLQRERSKNK